MTSDVRAAKGIAKLHELNRIDTSVKVERGLVSFGGAQACSRFDVDFASWSGIAEALEGLG